MPAIEQRLMDEIRRRAGGDAAALGTMQQILGSPQYDVGSYTAPRDYGYETATAGSLTPAEAWALRYRDAMNRANIDPRTGLPINEAAGGVRNPPGGVTPWASMGAFADYETPIGQSYGGVPVQAGASTTQPASAADWFANRVVGGLEDRYNRYFNPEERNIGTTGR